jgi:hypothetical protein
MKTKKAQIQRDNRKPTTLPRVGDNVSTNGLEGGHVRSPTPLTGIPLRRVPGDRSSQDFGKGSREHGGPRRRPTRNLGNAGSQVRAPGARESRNTSEVPGVPRRGPTGTKGSQENKVRTSPKVRDPRSNVISQELGEVPSGPRRRPKSPRRRPGVPRRGPGRPRRTPETA